MSSIDTAYYNRPTRAEISLSAIRNNFAIAKAMAGPGVMTMPMVKANAYGHGLETVTRLLLEEGADYIGVAYLEEGVYLRQRGITAPILVLGAINTEQIEYFIEYNIEITSSSSEKTEAIAKKAAEMGKRAHVHLKVDTGMERIGVHWYHADRFIDHARGQTHLEIKGIFSHLAKGESDREFTSLQIKRFREVINYMEGKASPEMIHLANSAGVLYHPDSHFNTIRPGIMLYGYDPKGYLPEIRYAGMKLQPAMTLKTKVSFFKVCPPETGISYNHTYKTKGQTRIVTLPIGYGDGYCRLLSNHAPVIIHGNRYNVVGSICMDQVMVDIGPDGTAYNGDDVLLFGEMNGSIIPLEELCEIIGTIPYEMVCNISSRVPRIYVEKGPTN
jgi:alanine racemase